MTWGRFFRRLFGDPRWCLALVVVGAVIYAVANPGWLSGWFHRLAAEFFAAVNPLIGPVFQLAIIAAVIVWIVRAPFRHSGKK
jgi:hypothetical protein